MDLSQSASSQLKNVTVGTADDPDSELHGKVCTEGCLVDGDYHTFCWHLDTNECEHDFLTTVIEKACTEVGLL